MAEAQAEGPPNATVLQLLLTQNQLPYDSVASNVGTAWGNLPARGLKVELSLDVYELSALNSEGTRNPRARYPNNTPSVSQTTKTCPRTKTSWT